MKENSGTSCLGNGYYQYLQSGKDFSEVCTASRAGMGAFLVCLQGEVHMAVNMRQQVLMQNSVLTLSPDSLCEVGECSEDFKGHWVVFPSSLACGGEWKENQLDFIVQIRERPVLHVSDDRMELALEYMTLLKSLYEQSNATSGPVVHGVIRSFLHALRIGYSRNGEKTGSPALGRKEIIFRDFVKLVQTHCLQERQVAFYANKLCITPKYLSTVIKSVYGHAPSYVINHAVILAAKAKLQTNQYTVQQVAESLGFGNASFFGTFFKRHVGCSPGKYLADGQP